MQNPVFSASLQDNTNPDVLWEESENALNGAKSACAFQNGNYHSYSFDPEGHLYTYCLAQQINAIDFTYEVQMSIVNGTAGGVFFRSQNSQNSPFSSYLFLIKPNGFYVLCAAMNTDLGTVGKGLINGTITQFNQGYGNTNTIAIVARGNQIDIYVNHIGIATVNDNTYVQGGLGVASWIKSDVVFSNAKFWTE